MSGRPSRKAEPVKGLVGPKAEKTVSLALQGGGAHGAFTWGVLDAVLEYGRLGIEALTGTSAGGAATGGATGASGWLAGGGSWFLATGSSAWAPGTWAWAVPPRPSR